MEQFILDYEIRTPSLKSKPHKMTVIYKYNKKKKKTYICFLLNKISSTCESQKHADLKLKNIELVSFKTAKEKRKVDNKRIGMADMSFTRSTWTSQQVGKIRCVMGFAFTPKKKKVHKEFSTILSHCSRLSLCVFFYFLWKAFAYIITKKRTYPFSGV